MPALTVLHVLEAVGHGTGRHLVDLVDHAAGVVHEVVLPHRPTPRGEGRSSTTVDALRARGVVVHEVPLRRSPAHPDLLRAIRSVRHLAGDRGVDVVHGHATVGGVVARLAAARTGRPVVVTPNGLHPSRAVQLAERALAPLTGAMIAVSASEAALLRARGLCPTDRIHVVPNGIALEVPPPHTRRLRVDLALDDATRLVGWIGRLSRQKAPEVLVAAAAGLPADVHVVLIGGGPDRDAVAAAARRAGTSGRVHLVGHVAGAAGLLPQLDVLALPSRWEGAPYVPLEAFRAGVPVVASDVTGTRDVVLDGDTGWLVPPDDPGGLSRALAEALADPDEAARRASRGRARLVDHHDVRDMGRQTAALYAKVASQSGMRG